MTYAPNVVAGRIAAPTSAASMRAAATRESNSKGGAQGVGTATTLAEVSASILILAFNYVLTEMFFAR